MSAAAFLLFFLTGCQQRVVLTPGEDDLVVLNGCVISACNYLAVVKTQHTLDQNFWAKILWSGSKSSGRPCLLCLGN